MKAELYPADKEKLRQAFNLLNYIKNDLSAIDHPDNLHPDILEAIRLIQESEKLLIKTHSSSKLYGVDVPYPVSPPM